MYAQQYAYSFALEVILWLQLLHANLRLQQGMPD